MKEAIIFFDGKEIKNINFDRNTQLFNLDGAIIWTKFFLNNEEVAFFDSRYSYIIKQDIDND
jgi:hypothetical protein